MAEQRVLTPPHLVARVLGHRSALEGERKHITVLFADIVGSLALAARLDPEAWHALLDRFFRLLGNAVYRFEGTINQYTGDGIMALFGAPIAHEDHAQRACHAALQISRDLMDLARQVQREHGLALAARMGLNSGSVVVGKIGDDLRMDYTAQGATVGVAARMQEIAPPSTAVLAEATAELVREYFALDALGPVQIKGISAPVAAFALAGLGAARTRLEASRVRGLSRFVGRDGEMAVLCAALERACAGLGQVVGVVGAAGLGKSRLCEELLARCRAEGVVAVHEVHCVAHATAIPSSTVAELLRSLLGIAALEDPRLSSLRLTRRLTELGGVGVHAEPVARAILGLPFAGTGAPIDPEGDPGAHAHVLTALLAALLRGEARHHPLVVLIDDAHWIDSESERVLAAVARSIPTLRALLLVNVRPGHRASWMDGAQYQEIGLSPLDPDGVAALAGDLLGPDSSLAPLIERIGTHASGNPYFVEEIVRALRASGVLAGAPGAHSLSGPLDETVIPPTVSALLGARIDSLDDDAKHVLQSAAVIGKRFAASVLEEVAQVSRESLGSALARLEELDFVRLDGIDPAQGYSFRHPLVQEVAYRSQLTARRQHLHAAAARALQRLAPDRLAEHAGVIAQHWDAAGMQARAWRWRRLAALNVTHIQARRPEPC